MSSQSVTSGASDNCPVATQTCRMTNAPSGVFLGGSPKTEREGEVLPPPPEGAGHPHLKGFCEGDLVQLDFGVACPNGVVLRRIAYSCAMRSWQPTARAAVINGWRGSRAWQESSVVVVAGCESAPLNGIRWHIQLMKRGQSVSFYSMCRLSKDCCTPTRGSLLRFAALLRVKRRGQHET